jgi:hypothetical protein
MTNLNWRFAFVYTKWSKYIVLLGIFIGLYVIATLHLPISQETLNKYEVTLPQARLLYFSIVIPYFIIWTMAFYGFIRLKEYTHPIRDTADGRGLNRIANGLMILAISLPIIRLVSVADDYVFARFPAWGPAAIIFKNYLTIVLTLAAFIFIARGGKELTGAIHKKTSMPYKMAATIGFLLLAGVYAYFALSNPMRRVSADPILRAAYHLPDWLIILTIILPYLYVWYIGLQAALDIHFYKNKVKGFIYKPFLGSLAVGISWVIASSILLQFFNALRDTLAQLSLRPLLILVYVLLLFTSIGYILIARAAHNLKRIEEV